MTMPRNHEPVTCSLYNRDELSEKIPLPPGSRTLQGSRYFIEHEIIPDKQNHTE